VPRQLTAAAVAERAIARWLFLAALLLYVASATGVLVYGDDLSMLAVTRSLASGRLDVPAGTPAAVEGVDGRFYSKAGIGQSLIAVPFFAAGSIARQWWRGDAVVDDAGLVRANAVIYIVSLIGPLATALAVAMLFRTCRATGCSVAASVTAAAALGVCTFAWHYARTFMTEPTSMAAALAAFYALFTFTETREDRWLAASGATSGCAILLRVPNGLIVAILGAWLAFALFSQRRDGLAAALRHAVAWTLPIAVAIVVIAAYDALRFGSVFETGYGDEARAFTTPLVVGLAGFLISPGKSLFVYAPILAAAVIGWPALVRRQRLVACVAGAIVIAPMLFFARYYQWYGGGVWGPRFLVMILPFLLLGLAALVDEVAGRVWPRVALGTIAAVSAAIQIVSVVVPYIPYQARANATAESFAAFLWQPRASAVIVETMSLVRREFPPDIAPVYYHSPALVLFQGAALAGAILAAIRVVALTISETPRAAMDTPKSRTARA
jgi:dolichyl-phosphate-mannose-protein mannosyltransferase